MRFLVDRCTGTRVADWLRSKGHDVVEAREMGPDPGDLRLLELANEQERIVVTIDTDFPKLVFLGGHAHRGMVRLPDVPATERISMLGQALQRHGDALESAAVLTIRRGGTIRISRRS